MGLRSVQVCPLKSFKTVVKKLNLCGNQRKFKVLSFADTEQQQTFVSCKSHQEDDDCYNPKVFSPITLGLLCLSGPSVPSRGNSSSLLFFSRVTARCFL